MSTSNKIFIVHGWTYGLSKWDGLIEELKSRDLEPVMLHVPGLSAPSDEVWDIAKYVEWVRTEISEEDKPNVVGHSNGGRILMAYDAKYPGHINELILISSAGIYHNEPAISLKRRVFKTIAKVLKPIMRGPFRKVAYRLIGAQDYGNAKPNMRQTMTNVTEFDKTFEISGVTAETTLIWGKDDRATPFSDAAMIRDQIQNPLDLHGFDGVGHSPHADKPAEVAEIIANRLAS